MNICRNNILFDKTLKDLNQCSIFIDILKMKDLSVLRLTESEYDFLQTRSIYPCYHKYICSLFYYRLYKFQLSNILAQNIQSGYDLLKNHENTSIKMAKRDESFTKGKYVYNFSILDNYMSTTPASVIYSFSTQYSRRLYISPSMRKYFIEYRSNNTITFMEQMVSLVDIDPSIIYISNKEVDSLIKM